MSTTDSLSGESDPACLSWIPHCAPMIYLAWAAPATSGRGETFKCKGLKSFDFRGSPELARQPPLWCRRGTTQRAACLLFTSSSSFDGQWPWFRRQALAAYCRTNDHGSRYSTKQRSSVSKFESAKLRERALGDVPCPSFEDPQRRSSRKLLEMVSPIFNLLGARVATPRRKSCQDLRQYLRQDRVVSNPLGESRRRVI